ncbi:mono/diheme cytochrome c family protein [Deinococcus yavapaiensis KR-236]|uniref:Mono/diheme cytochrome c family protein n=2 Tax=Deinococcus TaxID=1298 RepID=A0A318SCZ3_9DEIO|nr:mono/diheme cytochrome c family protein [Deinococcus yavapaiensis KR-236]
MALLLGGGLYAYHIGTAKPAEVTDTTNETSVPNGENNDATGNTTDTNQGEASPQQGGSADRGVLNSTANAGRGGVQGRASNEGSGSVDGEQKETGEQGQAAPDNRGDMTEGQGTVPQANRTVESTESQNQAQGRVGSDTAQANSGLTQAAGNVGQGKTYYESNCQGCHGEKGQGVVGPRLVGPDAPSSWDVGKLRKVLVQYIDPDSNQPLQPPMPNYSQTNLIPKGGPASDADVADILAYLKTL